ncbi:MAG: cytochrome-c oxidase, cbb3-type subunit II, partial [Ignavibacteria bacterium]
VTQIIPMYMIRSVGGLMFFTGVIAGVFNLAKTIKQGTIEANEPAEAPAREVIEKGTGSETRHRWLEKRPLQFALLATVLVLIGGLVELIPTFLVKSNVPTIFSVKPYTPLELQGRDLYIREGCNNCHSQMVRPFRSETERYGEYSKAGEFVYDHPFLWGSKRTGPDLHREGKKYPNVWHYLHMDDPRQISPGSIMPSYSWMLSQNLDISTTESKIRAMQTLGVPYPAGYEKTANDDLMKQAQIITDDLQKNGAPVTADKEIIALIAYLQRLGVDIKGDLPADVKGVK